MAKQPAVNERSLDRYRSYLRMLACVHLHPALQGKLDPSDLVQQTFLQAYQSLENLEGRSDAEVAAWLRTALGRNLAHSLRDFGRARRDVTRERSLDAAVEASSLHVQDWLAADASSPSQQAVFHEETLRLAQALDRLPEGQREALILQHWHGWSLAEIGQRLDRTPMAVAGLIKRGLRTLRELLDS